MGFAVWGMRVRSTSAPAIGGCCVGKGTIHTMRQELLRIRFSWAQRRGAGPGADAHAETGKAAGRMPEHVQGRIRQGGRGAGRSIAPTASTSRTTLSRTARSMPCAANLGTNGWPHRTRRTLIRSRIGAVQEQISTCSEPDAETEAAILEIVTGRREIAYRHADGRSTVADLQEPRPPRSLRRARQEPQRGRRTENRLFR